MSRNFGRSRKAKKFPIVTPRERRVSRNFLHHYSPAIPAVTPRERRVSRNPTDLREHYIKIVTPRERRVSRNYDWETEDVWAAKSRLARGV